MKAFASQPPHHKVGEFFLTYSAGASPIPTNLPNDVRIPPPGTLTERQPLQLITKADRKTKKPFVPPWLEKTALGERMPHADRSGDGRLRARASGLGLRPKPSARTPGPEPPDRAPDSKMAGLQFPY